MLTHRKIWSEAGLVWIVTAFALLLKILFIYLTSMRGLGSTTWLIDDSFIEMRVAQNLGLGNGFSLDGIHPTTGAPFLWIYLTSINHALLGTDAAIRATLLETAIFGGLCCVITFFLARKVTGDRRVAWTAFILSTFTLNAFTNAMNGMDTALFTFLVLLSVATLFSVGRPKHCSDLQWGCVTGLALGLTLMTRGDGIFVAFGLLCAKAYEWWRASHAERAHHLRSLVGILLISGLCFSFFMGWQLLQTGSPFPGNQVGRRGLALAWHNFSFDHFSLPRYLAITGWNVFQLEDILTMATGSALLCFVALVSGSLHRKLRTLSIFSWIYMTIFFALLVAYQWYFANLHGLRYVNPAVHILFIYVGFLAWNLPAEFGRRTGALLVIAATLILGNYKYYQMVSRLPWAPYMSMIGRPTNMEKNTYFWGTIDWIRDNLPPETIVGVRDYGRISMFGDVKIQDLAGNIDPQVAVALNDGTLRDYLKKLNVTYLLIPSLDQRSDYLYQYLHKNLPLELVKEAPLSPGQKLYKIQWGN